MKKESSETAKVVRNKNDTKKQFISNFEVQTDITDKILCPSRKTTNVVEHNKVYYKVLNTIKYSIT